MDEQVSFVDSLFESSPSQAFLKDLLGGAEEDGREDTDDAPDLSGQRLGEGDRFELVERLGTGGFGSVYVARDLSGGGRVALKVLDRRASRDVWLFKNEFRVLAEMNHPHLVQLHELHQAGDRWFFTMELVEGQHLDRWVRPEGRLDLARLRRALRQLASALYHLHARGRVHRDVKPENIMVDGTGRVVVLDFGLATTPDQVGVGFMPGAGAGTAAFLAPESRAGEAAGPPSDWYAVGVILYGLLVGRVPKSGAIDLAALVRHEIPRDLAGLATQLLAHDPEERPSGEAILAETAAWGDAPTLIPEPSSYVGRAEELAKLNAAYETAAAGASATVIVRGRAGVGKTALLQRFAALLAERPDPPLVLHGRCFAEESLPFKALDQALDQLAHLLSGLPERLVHSLIPRGAPSLARLFPALSAALSVPPDRQQPEEEAQRVAREALVELFERLTAQRPVVLLIDDLQWGDAESAALIRDLLVAPRAHVLAVFGLRPSHRAAHDAPGEWLRTAAEVEVATWFPALLMGLRLSEGVSVETLELGPLTQEDAVELALELLPEARTNEHEALRVAEAAEGSPLFVRELARHAPGEDLPALDVDGVLKRRMDTLSEPARALLEAVALAGRPIQRRLVARAAGVEEELAAVAELRRAELIVLSGAGLSGTVEPAHDRVRRVATTEMVRAGRWEGRCRDLAQALSASGVEEPEMIAALLAGSGDRGAAARTLVEASERVRSPDERRRLLEAALSHVGPDEPRYEEIRGRLLDASDAPVMEMTVTTAGGPGEDGFSIALERSRYQRLELLGEGAMGEVHLARDSRLGRKVAIKQLRAGTTTASRGRFLREVQIASQLDHPQIVPIYDLAWDAIGPGYSMKLIEGRDLATLIREAREIREAGEPADHEHALVTLLGHFLKVCDAIHYAHDKGVIHRDLKPANIRIGDHNAVYVLDWGVARLMHERSAESAADVELGTEAELVQTRAGEMVGTPAYMAPEQAAGGPIEDGKADQFSLGMVLYELVALKPARSSREAGLAEALQGVLAGRWAPLPSSVPRELAAIVGKALAKDPGQRYESVAALADDIRSYLRGQELVALPDGPVKKAWRWAREHRRWALGTVLPLVLVIPTLAAAGITVWSAQNQGEALVDGLSGHLRHEIGRRVTGHLEDFVATPVRVNLELHGMMALGELRWPGSKAPWRRALKSIVERHEVRGFAMYANEQGDYLAVERRPDGSFGWEYADATTSGHQWQFFMAADGTVGEEEMRFKYDPTVRPWYVRTKQLGAANWSEPYAWMSRPPVLAITFCQPFYDDEGAFAGVLGTDIRIDAISTFLQSLQIGRTGVGFVVDRKGRVLGSSVSTGQAGELLSVAEWESPLMRRVGAHLEERFGSVAAATEDQQWSFEMDGERYLTQTQRFQTAEGLDWTVVLVIPESDYMSHLEENTQGALMLGGIVLLMGVLLGLVLALRTRQAEA